MAFTLTIITPDGRLFEDTVDSLVAPGARGSFGVLPNHAPMVAALGKGVLKAEIGGKPVFFSVGGGVADVKPDSVTILADTAAAVPAD